MEVIHFNQLFSQYYRRVFSVAFSVAKDRFLAEDIVQETFLKAYQKLDTLKDVCKIGAWLSAIAVRTAIDVLRAEKRKSGLAGDSSLMQKVYEQTATRMNTEEQAAVRLLQEELFQSINLLSADYRNVLLLNIHNGLNEKEIAELLHLKPATVKTRLYRARQQLKRAVLGEEIA
ncbi:RNA polymerase sigma factor [Neobacillus sp. SM06]|uniref:RNA polymerase sigma factor n=1 Tax=Neobacillus sp. SM06 TaxID=3422492 RepID=UPI003D2C4348